MTAKTFTREELYERVWTEPVDRVARELGISNVGLGKLCRRHQIPVPPRGFWARKAAGHKIRQAPLPPLNDPRHARIVVHGSPASPDGSQPLEAHPLVAFEQLPENHVAVPANLELSHLLVLKTARLLRRSKRDAAGLVAVPAGALRLHTSRALHDRGLRIWQALLAAFEKRQYAVQAVDDRTRLIVLDEALEIAIYEDTKQVEHRVTFTEQRAIDRGQGWSASKSDHVPSGELTLAITNVSNVRRRWSDGKRLLEEELNKFLVGIVRAALELKRQREDAERRERERQQEERQRLEAERRWREEKGRRDRLDRLVAAWERAEKVRTFVAAYRAVVGPVEPESDLGHWLAWLEARALKIDPLRRMSRDASLTLYHATYDSERILQHGFSDPNITSWGRDEPPGVLLADQPGAAGHGSRVIELSIPETVALPYEWVEEGSGLRKFYVPAEILNSSARPPGRAR